MSYLCRSGATCVFPLICTEGTVSPTDSFCSSFLVCGDAVGSWTAVSSFSSSCCCYIYLICCSSGVYGVTYLCATAACAQGFTCGKTCRSRVACAFVTLYYSSCRACQAVQCCTTAVRFFSFSQKACTRSHPASRYYSDHLALLATGNDFSCFLLMRHETCVYMVSVHRVTTLCVLWRTTRPCRRC